MRILELTLQSKNIAAQQAFYSDTLGLPVVIHTDNRITFQAGASRLTFEQGNAAFEGHYHYAFNIPQSQFEEAKRWLARRTTLLSDQAGQTKFHFLDWNAHSFYFSDADGNIVEFIARHNLDNAPNTPFTAESLLCISEIGLSSPDVLKTVSSITKALKLEVWRGKGSDTFTAVGDENGLFIVVSAGRTWYPNNEISARPYPTHIIVADAPDFIVPDLPYYVYSASPIQA